MKHTKRHFLTSLFCIAILSLVTSSCVKDPEVIIDKPEITSEKFDYYGNRLHITGSYTYTTKLKSIYFFIGDSPNPQSMKPTIATLKGNNEFDLVENGILSNHTYYYYYELITSLNSVKTEIKEKTF